MSTILVVANETLGGAKLLDAVRAKAGPEDRVIVCVPRKTPSHGNVIYADAVFDAARVRIDLARLVLRSEGITAVGDIGDPEPFTATMDAIDEYRPDEIIISTLPGAASGWQRKDLVERVTAAARGIPVTHVEVDLATEGLPVHVTLVVANRTSSADELLARLQARTSDKPVVHILVVPQEGGEGVHVARARARLGQMVDRFKASGLFAAGLIADPDPYTATMNALELFRVDDIVISTLPATRSGWLRADLIERVRNASNKPVEHVETTASAPAAV